MSEMLSSTQSAISSLLAPAELVLAYSIDELSKKKKPEQLVELWQRIVNNYNEYVNKFAGNTKPDIDREIRAKFDAALLLIAATLQKLNFQQQGITDYFKPEEIQHILALESFKNLNKIPMDSLIEMIKKNDQTIQNYINLYNYYEQNLNSLSQTMPRIANAYAIVYKRYARRIEEALAEFRKEQQQ